MKTTISPVLLHEARCAHIDALTQLANRRRFDELLDKALRSTSQPERAKLYEEATRIVVADAPGIWIYNTKWYGPYTKNLQGIVFCPIGSAQEMRTAYYD